MRRVPNIMGVEKGRSFLARLKGGQAPHRSHRVFGAVLRAAFGRLSHSTRLRVPDLEIVEDRSLVHTSTVTRRKVAGMDVVFLSGLWFWLVNRSSSSRCKSAVRPFFSAASNAFIVGP